ncbi:hypothetical protein KK083_24920 [Fulvivirgaceae bacterium PWU4]|uniref:Uncharacterized protein n=1 Tax=Chryseosolibacter histidini TaxID=2782349 RepID=A0AAP2DPH3_9BACT|nr:hypothetical protein [Chryseosolibacter histidini]MBT1700155.1 hypothetical protein [Chryseosolibacter histidini]
MAQIYDIYSSGIKRKLNNYWAAWLPTTKYQLGDIGILNGNVFEKIGSLKELKIDYKTQDDTSSSPLELVSEAGVSFQFKVAGETNPAFESVPVAEAGVKIKLESAGAFTVLCPDSYEPSIDEPMALQKRIIEAYEKRVWESDWTVITRLITAPSATILISNSLNSDVELSASADLKAALAQLGKADLGLSLKSQRGDMFKMIGAREITPFFQVAKLKRRWFGDPKLRTRSVKISDKSSMAASTVAGEKQDLYLDILKDGE